MTKRDDIRLLVLAGDGIGPEITGATVVQLEVLRRRFEPALAWDVEEIGLARLARHGRTMAEDLIPRIRTYAGAILGPLSTADYPRHGAGAINVSSELRRSLELYANIRPCRSRPGISRHAIDMDLILVRENTEGFFADRSMYEGNGEFMPTPDLALAVRKITAEASRRIAAVAFTLASARRRRVAAVHKRNTLKLSDGLFLREVRRVAADHPEVALREVLVDAMAALLIRDPSAFDVIVTTNLFGDILSDAAAELSGSLGLAGSLNAGPKMAIAQAVHGSAPELAGRDQANPVGLLLSTAMLLDWLGRRRTSSAALAAGAALTTAVEAVLADPRTRTADLGGPIGTHEFGDRVAYELARLAK